MPRSQGQWYSLHSCFLHTIPRNGISRYEKSMEDWMYNRFLVELLFLSLLVVTSSFSSSISSCSRSAIYRRNENSFNIWWLSDLVIPCVHLFKLNGRRDGEFLLGAAILYSYSSFSCSKSIPRNGISRYEKSMEDWMLLIFKPFLGYYSPMERSLLPFHLAWGPDS